MEKMILNLQFSLQQWYQIIAIIDKYKAAHQTISKVFRGTVITLMCTNLIFDCSFDCQPFRQAVDCCLTIHEDSSSSSYKELIKLLLLMSQKLIPLLHL